MLKLVIDYARCMYLRTVEFNIMMIALSSFFFIFNLEMYKVIVAKAEAAAQGLTSIFSLRRCYFAVERLVSCFGLASCHLGGVSKYSGINQKGLLITTETVT